MAKIKLGLRDKDVSEKIQLSKDVETGMTGNVNFPTPDPPIATLVTARTTAETSLTSYNAAKIDADMKKTLLDNAEADLEQVLKNMANYVEGRASGDVAMIQSAGMDTMSGKTPPQVPAQVLIKEITESNISGQLIIKWGRISNAKSYRVDMNLDVNIPDGWEEVDTITKTKLIVNGLNSGVKYWFRVQAIGAAGRGAWSDPAVKYAP